MSGTVLWALAALSVLACAWNAVLWIRESLFVSRFLTSALGRDGPVETREDLVRLQAALTSTIAFDTARMHDSRSPLRASARETLSRGYGFCGENARAAILLLKAGGVRAHRLYLEGARWGHVVVEHEWNDGWRLFDAHGDPATLPVPDELGRIDTADLGAFPNRVEDNPWVSSSRIPQLRRVPGLRKWARTRLPSWLVTIVESPAAVRYLLAGLAALALLALQGSRGAP